MKRTYFCKAREDGVGYYCFVYAKNIEEAKKKEGVESVLYRVTPKERRELAEQYGCSYGPAREFGYL